MRSMATTKGSAKLYSVQRFPSPVRVTIGSYCSILHCMQERQLLGAYSLSRTQQLLMPRRHTVLYGIRRKDKPLLA